MRQPIPFPRHTEKLKGQKMALVANISSIDKGTGVTTFLKPLFGNVNTLVLHFESELNHLCMLEENLMVILNLFFTE